MLKFLSQWMKKLKILNLKALIILKKLIVPRNIFQIKNRE